VGWFAQCISLEVALVLIVTFLGTSIQYGNISCLVFTAAVDQMMAYFRVSVPCSDWMF